MSLQNCTSSIKHLKKNADRFQGKKVRISGEVISSLDLLDINCFTLKDRSGNILIVTDNLLPLKRDKIKVKGTFEKAYHYKKQNFMVVMEKKMKLQKPIKSDKIRAKTY
ncbi:MAG: hypothetical protein P1P88_03525 [Bacteroidales bacterium]|nr:hypothetical protein [Bacteroidales bacterium]